MTTTGARSVNSSDTGAYRLVDHFASRAVRSLSRVVGVKNITKPFWNRWRASSIGDETLTRFLDSINGIDDWPVAGGTILAEEEKALDRSTDRSTIDGLRRLSYLAHLAQWGCLPINETKRELYRKSRDFYVEAESLAWGDRYRRIEVPWGQASLFGNLHLPPGPAGTKPRRLIVILHGMDDTKEEHLATELFLQEQGFAVLCLDGPGQGESLLLDDITWPSDYARCVTSSVSAVAAQLETSFDAVGLVGVSWGGMWAMKAAAQEPLVKAVYDLGGPVDASRFARLPFFLKTKYCQVLGISSAADIPNAEELFSLKKDELKLIDADVRIVHGGKDPLVPVSDKEWLQSTLRTLHPDVEVSLVVHPTGDHCCTAEAAVTRQDTAEFFNRSERFTLREE